MIRNSNFTCNSKMNHMEDYIDVFKLPKSESKIRQISKPVKIAQLFGVSKSSHTSQKESAVKISQPERITPYMQNKSVQKKDESAVKRSQPERITPYMRNTSARKKKGTNIINRFQHKEKNVRRNLKFSETPPTTKNTRQIVKADTSNLTDKFAVNEKRLHTHGRKSLILPPDSIKNMHLAQNKFKQNKSMFIPLNHTRILTEKSVSKCPTISERSESSLLVAENINVSIDTSVVMQQKNNKTSVIQHTSSQIPKANNRSGLNILHSSNINLINPKNDVVGKETFKRSNTSEALNINVYSDQNSNNNVTINKLQVPPMRNTDVKKDFKLYNGRYLNLETNAVCTPGVEKIKVEDMYAPLQVIKTTSERCVDSQHCTDDNRECVILSKQELTVLTFNLEHLIYKINENISYLKSTSTCVGNLLSAITTSKMANDNEIESKAATESLKKENVIENSRKEEVTENLRKEEVIENSRKEEVTENLRKEEVTENLRKEEVTENLSDNAKVVNSTNTISSPCDPIIVNEVDHKSKGVSKTLNSDALICAETDVPKITENQVEVQPSLQTDFAPEDNKENYLKTNSFVKHSKSQYEPRRRSARLMAKALMNSNTDNDSFVNLEHELNIVSAESVTPILSRASTPATNNCKDRKKGRPWKEYMALKSRMSCLLTPNVKQLNSTELRNNVHSETGGTKTSLSNKILSDLHNLYSDSPDSQ